MRDTDENYRIWKKKKKSKNIIIFILILQRVARDLEIIAV